MKNKSGQAWGFDLVVASSIFFVALMFFYFFAFNTSPEANSNLEDLTIEAETVSDFLLSEGYPTNWNYSNVTNIGLLSENKINETKLDNFYQLSTTEYNATKSMFGIRNNYFISLSEEIVLQNGTKIGGIGVNNSQAENLIQITRYIIYNNKPAVLTVQIWR